MSHQEFAAIDKSVDIDTDSCRTDDSEQEDPSFDILEETRSRFSNLSVKKKSASRSRIAKKIDEEEEAETVAEEVVVPELDEKDKKSFEVVQKIIEVGQVEKLKVDQCKVYLRKHGLRLTGNKDILLQRIREHLSIMNGEGEEKYPASSFVMNCKGDACTGDVVMFEQNVYEMFNIASRSASGPPCGTRLVVGRIVKESYGAAKQQHTFTIEVLWSKGEKPLPPLHPLLIKGRNLYRLKTMRQRWEDEGERQKILFEKHSRGSLARSSRDARIQEKEMRKTLRQNRVLRTKDHNGNLEESRRKASRSPLLNKGVPGSQPNKEHVGQKINQEQTFQHQKSLRPWKESNSVPTEIPERVPIVLFPKGTIYKENINSDLSMGMPPLPVDSQRQHFNPSNSSFGGHIGKQQMNFNAPKSPLRTFSQYQPRTNVDYTGTQFHGWHGHQSQPQRQNFQEVNNGVVPSYRVQGQGHEQKQICKYYPQGRCYYGDRCKYLH